MCLSRTQVLIIYVYPILIRSFELSCPLTSHGEVIDCVYINRAIGNKSDVGQP